MEPFDFVNVINNKLDKPEREEIDANYNPFLTNRSLSYFLDTVFLANEMNQSYNLPKDMQFDFLYEMVDKRRRFSKWNKQDKSIEEKLSILKTLYNYSTFRARETIPLIDSLGIWDDLKKEIFVGGVTK